MTDLDTIFSVVAIPTVPAQYVSLLGTGSYKTDSLPDSPPNQNATSCTATVASVTMATNESIFVAISANFDRRIVGNPLIGWVVSDNLGNTYTFPQGPVNLAVPLRDQYLYCALASCIPSVAGTLTSITITWPFGVWYAGALVAGRFRYIGATESSTVETKQGTGSSNGNDAVLTTAGSSLGIGISARISETAGGFITYTSGTTVGRVSTSGGGDETNLSLALGYAQPEPAVGLKAYNYNDDGRCWFHLGKAYSAKNPWP